MWSVCKGLLIKCVDISVRSFAIVWSLHVRGCCVAKVTLYSCSSVLHYSSTLLFQSLIELICDVKSMEKAVMEMQYDAKKAPLGKTRFSSK